MDECADVEGEEHEGCGAVEKSILRWRQKMVTSHCSNQGRGRFSRRPQNFVTLNSPCGVLGDWAKQLASSTSKLCILGLIEVKLPKV